MEHIAYRKGLYVANAADSVGTALSALDAGEAACLGEATAPSIVLNEPIPFGFKAALRDMVAGEPVIKYGIQIAIATQPIHKGDKVHLHNCKSAYDVRSSTLDPETAAPTDIDYTQL